MNDDDDGEGCILNVESQEMKFHEWGMDVDPDESCWVESVKDVDPDESCWVESVKFKVPRVGHGRRP